MFWGGDFAGHAGGKVQKEGDEGKTILGNPHGFFSGFERMLVFPETSKTDFLDDAENPTFCSAQL